jgi:hypothetical protein
MCGLRKDNATLLQENAALRLLRHASAPEVVAVPHVNGQGVGASTPSTGAARRGLALTGDNIVLASTSPASASATRTSTASGLRPHCDGARGMRRAARGTARGSSTSSAGALLAVGTLEEVRYNIRRGSVGNYNQEERKDLVSAILKASISGVVQSSGLCLSKASGALSLPDLGPAVAVGCRSSNKGGGARVGCLDRWGGYGIS